METSLLSTDHHIFITFHTIFDSKDALQIIIADIQGWEHVEINSIRNLPSW